MWTEESTAFMASLATTLKEEIQHARAKGSAPTDCVRGQGGGAMCTRHRGVEARGAGARARPCIVGHRAARAARGAEEDERTRITRSTGSEDGGRDIRFRQVVAAESILSGEALKAHRERLGLSAENYGKLLGAAAMSVYNWEQGNARPRKSSVDAWTAIRRIGKREAARRLANLKAAEPKSESKQTPAEK